jgi:adenylate cyclase
LTAFLPSIPTTLTFTCTSRRRRTSSWVSSKKREILKRRLVRNPETDISRALLASGYGHLGRNDEARKEWQELLRVNPNYSVEHRRKVLPYKTPSDFELFVDGLRKVGLAK